MCACPTDKGGWARKNLAFLPSKVGGKLRVGKELRVRNRCWLGNQQCLSPECKGGTQNLDLKVGICGRQNRVHPKDVHVLMLRTCEYDETI